MFYIFHTAIHLGAGIRRQHTIQKLVAALDGPLQDGPAGFAHDAGHIVSTHLDGTGSGRSQPHGKTTWKVQQRFRDQGAGIADGNLSPVCGLPHQVVMGFLEQGLQIIDMF